MTAWKVEPDAHGNGQILSRGDQWVATFRDDVIEVAPEYMAQLRGVLTSVLAPDEATVERLAMAMAKSEAVSWDLNLQAWRDHYNRLAEAALDALVAAAPAERDGEVGAHG